MKPPSADQSTLRLVQRALEEQGYVILAHTSPCEPGTILSHFGVGPPERRRSVSGPVVVIGEATEEEWYGQRRKYFPTAIGRIMPGLSFLKVVAE